MPTQKEETEVSERRTGTLFEQHMGTVLQFVVVGLLSWSLATTQDMSKEVAVLKIQVNALQATLSQGTQDRYRSVDAAKDFKAVYDELGRYDRRIDINEKRVIELERRK